MTDTLQFEVVALAVEVPDILRSFPTGTVWPLMGEVIFTKCRLG
jgi:hypothetical protein